ncbi:MAG: hypothetical protein ACREL5_12155 [Gemmatimonadales bacterium]
MEVSHQQQADAVGAGRSPRGLDILLLAVAIVCGLAIAWVDSRPGWDDTGITAFAMLLAATVLGFIAPRRPWRWALAIGVWIPLHLVAQSPTWATIRFAPLVLIFPLVGAYAGMLVRRLVATS